ncbi:MAG: UbiA family prenyltransferase, partial [Pseudomonadota bacterium]
MEGGPDNSLTGDEGRVQDATDLNWVDRFAPPEARPFLRLSRMDRPIGTWLLLLPCWWGILLAVIEDGWRWIDLWLFPACAIGALLMRGAGCTWNDIQDREIDAQVDRTQSRPLPSGQVRLSDAALWLVAQAMWAFVILLSFNPTAIWWGVASLLPVAVYPFAKRFTWWPQAFLGVAFNWGILLMWVAHSGS